LRLAWLIALSGCASVGPNAFFRSATANPEHDNRVMDDFTVHRNNPTYGDVTVVEENGKEKLELIDGSAGKFRGADIEIIGTFELKPTSHSPFAFTDYSAVPRKVICWPQVPLTWITLGIWLAVPTSYFCWSKTPGTREKWLAWVKQMVDSAGGDIGVVTFIGPPDNIDWAKGYIVRTRAP
jgi:hypothetical protein